MHYLRSPMSPTSCQIAANSSKHTPIPLLSCADSHSPSSPSLPPFLFHCSPPFTTLHLPLIPPTSPSRSPDSPASPGSPSPCARSAHPPRCQRFPLPLPPMSPSRSPNHDASLVDATA